MKQRGLTLLEVLLALAILSAIAASGAVIWQQSRRAIESSQINQAASQVLHRWILEHRLHEAATSSSHAEWSWTDTQGGVWTVVREHTTRPAQVLASSKPETAQETGLAIRWIPVSLSYVRDPHKPRVMCYDGLVPAWAGDSTDEEAPPP